MVHHGIFLVSFVFVNVIYAQRSSFLDRNTDSRNPSSQNSFSSGNSGGNFPLTGGNRPASASGSNFGSSDFGFSSNSRDRVSSTSNDDRDFDTFDSDAQKARIQTWPQGVIPYEISSDIADVNAAALRRMFASISDKTCVQFVPRRNEANYTLIKGGSGCSAPLGMSNRPTQTGSSSASRLTGSTSSRMVTGASTVVLAPGCFTTKRVARRIMNLLGIPHEASRPDRDDFVEINMNNLRAGYADNVQKYTASSYPPGVLAIPYDFESVTQYNDEDLARDPKTWAIRPKNSRSNVRLGGDTFSTKDFQKIAAAYECGRLTSSRGSGSSTGGRDTFSPASGSSFGSGSGTRDTFGSGSRDSFSPSSSFGGSNVRDSFSPSSSFGSGSNTRDSFSPSSSFGSGSNTRDSFSPSSSNSRGSSTRF